MSIILRKTAQLSPPVPGTPPVTAERKYTVIKRVPIYKREPVYNINEADYIYNPSINSPFLSTAGLFEGGTSGIYNWTKNVLVGYRDSTEVVTETVVLAPGTPPRPGTPLPAQWDATAWSIDSFPDPMRASFHVGSGKNGGIRAGLTYRTVTAPTAESDIAHGFKIENNVAYAFTAPIPGTVPAAGEVVEKMPYAYAPAGTKLGIEVIGGRVRYFVGDTLMAEHPSYLDSYQVHLAGALYSDSDTIVDPEIKALDPTGRGAATIVIAAQGGTADSGKLRLRVQASGGHKDAGAAFRLFAQGCDGLPGYGTAKIHLPKAQGFGYTGADGTGAARLLRGIVALGSDYDYAGGAVTLVALVMARTDEIPTDLHGSMKGRMQVLEATLPILHRGFRAEMGGGVAFDGAISPGVPLNASGRLGTLMNGSLRLLQSFESLGVLGDDMRGTIVRDVAFVSTGQGEAPMGGLVIVTEALSFVGGVQAQLLAGRATDANHSAAALASLDLTPQQILSAALDALGRIGAEVGMPGQNLSVWSVNAETGASAAYEDYPFNSFATFGGRHFGAASDGIYELVGGDDAGAPIQAHMNLGKRNFGSSMLKAMPYAYLGVASDGLMVVRVTTEGASYTYKARAASAEMQTQRVDFGRGLRANYFTLELMNEDGADFDLDAIELAVTPLTRRI